MRILIIGCGYVGLPLGAELVRQGHAVFGVRRDTAAEVELKAAGITPLTADITKPETLAKLPRDFDWVVNCVASGGGTAEDYRAIYLQGTRNVLAWLSSLDPRPSTNLKKFVYTSSTSVYGQNDGSVVKESSPTEPQSSKAPPHPTLSPVGEEGVRRTGEGVLGETARVLLETEQVLLDAAKQRNFPAVILRVAGIYGPDRGHLLKQYLKNEARLDGKGERTLNMIHRDDLIGVIIAALKSARPGEIYNAVDDEPVSQRTFFGWLAGALDKDLPPSAPEDAGANRKRGVTNKKVSNRKVRMELGYQFKYPNFRKGYTAELIRLDRAGLLPLEPKDREKR